MITHQPPNIETVNHINGVIYRVYHHKDLSTRIIKDLYSIQALKEYLETIC
jgi:hypothetical protein